MLLRATFAVCCAIGALTIPSAAADPSALGYVHLGAAHVKQADDATLYMGGVEVPGAAFETEGRWTLAAETGLFISEGIAVAISGVIPVTTPNIAAGTLTGLGNLGDETVGFYSATAQYHFGMHESITPYVGAGIGYMHVFDTEDGVVTDMSVDSALGGVVQAGVDVKLTENLGLFADVKRYFISTSASGTMGAAPITADARVDPWVISTGLSFSF